MVTIYGLMSTRDCVIRYVGKTWDIEKRFYKHYWSPKRGVSKWIWRERWAGYDLIYVIIASNADDSVERYWIDRIPDLVNDRMNRELAPLLQTEEDRQFICAIQASSKPRFQENWNGFIGVRYHPSYGAWSVRVQAKGFEYLQIPGDGGPLEMRELSYQGQFGRTKYQGDFYFSDPNDAINARDGARRNLKHQNKFIYRHNPNRSNIIWPEDYFEHELGWI